MSQQNLDFRGNGRNILNMYLKQQKNIEIIEKNIYLLSRDNVELYNQYIFEVCDLISSGEKLQDILDIIKNDKLGWKNKVYDEIYNKQQEEDSFIMNPFEVVEGALQCKCGSKRTISHTKQTRGGDESTTVFAKCMACKNTWVYSG